MADPAQQLVVIAQHCEKVSQSSQKFSRRHYYINYGLMIASLSGSIGAAVLAFWNGIDGKIVGIIALLPAICSSIVGQLRLAEKGNWHFRRKHAMDRIARDLHLASLRDPDWNSVEAANAKLAELEERFDADWNSDLAFRFQSDGFGARNPTSHNDSG